MMRGKTILLVGALLAVATGIVALTSGPHSVTTSNVRQVNSASASTMDAARASGPPPMPASFYGTVTVDGADAPEGTRVSAWIDRVMYAETHTFIYDGRAMYTIDVPADDPATPEVEGGRPGDTILFHIGELQADQIATWQGGTNTELDLTASNLPPCTLFLPLVLR